MDQNNNSQNDFLYALLANPAADASGHVQDLQQLINDYPQSGMLQALFAGASKEKDLKRASVYFNPRLLYKLINHPSSFNNVDSGSIYIQPGLHKNDHSESSNSVFHIEEETDAPVFSPTFREQQTEKEISEADYLNNSFTELSPIEDTDVAEHRLDEQVAVDNLTIETASETVELKTREVEFHPGLENILSFEESPSPQNENPEEAGTIDYKADAIVNEPFYQIEKEKEEPYLYDIDSALQADKLRHNAEEVLVNTGKPADTTVGNNINPELPAEETYSGTEKIDLINQSASEYPDMVQLPVQQAEPVNLLNERDIKPEKTIIPETSAGNIIDDDVYDEIIGIEQIHLNNIAAPEVKNEQADPVAGTDEEEDRLIIENIAATDFFMFDDAFGNHQNEEQLSGNKEILTETASFEKPEASPLIVPHISKGTESNVVQPNVTKDEHQDVSKYNDDKMPYTFMWWLDKTRREHAGVSQPYLEKSEPKTTPEKQPEDVLQQQYYSNIFHISSVEELNKDEAPQPFSFGIKKRSQQIIEKFIKEEPQIKPQSGDKIDNENKAKKSSEDRDEIITETLAAIYAEQMLYQKAIALYKKLVLKFPEKSVYFANKIEQLNKKTN